MAHPGPDISAIVHGRGVVIRYPSLIDPKELDHLRMMNVIRLRGVVRMPPAYGGEQATCEYDIGQDVIASISNEGEVIRQAIDIIIRQLTEYCGIGDAVIPLIYFTLIDPRK